MKKGIEEGREIPKALCLKNDIQFILTLDADSIVDMEADLQIRTPPLTDKEMIRELQEVDEENVSDESDSEIVLEEEKVKQPTRSEVNAALETLTKYSLFVVDGRKEIRNLANKVQKHSQTVKKQISILDMLKYTE